MSKQWWSSRAGFIAQGGCLLALFAWSVIRHSPSAPTHGPGAADAAETVIDNSEDAAVTTSEADARFVAPPTVRFRTDHPEAGSLNLRPVEEGSPERPALRQPVRPQSPSRRMPDDLAPRSPFEVSGNGATVYNAPPPGAD